MRLRIPHDFAMLGGASEAFVDGFVRLAEDDKGVLVRLLRDDARNAQATAGSVLYAARRGGGLLLAIRPASETDRMRRFRRPEHLDHIAVDCCGQPCRYVSIYDHGTGRFFDLDVPPVAAQTFAQEELAHVFVCGRCGRQYPLPL
ncbi:hypothetical protein GmRootA79_53470 (plasmid) [Acidovorax sp. A79]|uniref:hypothetical protein n=1 Tax=Acidovorax sp. A79 TaxID=3056107 RepID=UPI0034E8B496